MVAITFQWSIVVTFIPIISGTVTLLNIWQLYRDCDNVN